MATSTAPVSATVQPTMLMGCTNNVITYRAAGHETVCLQAPQFGMQVLANFNPANGDVIGLDDILEKTTARTDLSDLSKYVTAVVANGNTTLYFDPTGSGVTGAGTPIALLLGVQTSVAGLIAAGGVAYVPDRVTVTASFNTPLTLRPSGLETVTLRPPASGIAPEQLNGFDPAKGDVLELGAVLAKTGASSDLSDIRNYLSVTVSNGNAILSVDRTGSGQAGTAFAQLNGVSLTLDQLLADGAISDTQGLTGPANIPLATQTATGALPAGTIMRMGCVNQTITFRPAGNEILCLQAPQYGVQTIASFNPAKGDVLGLDNILAKTTAAADLSDVGRWISASVANDNTTLYFDPTGSGRAGTAFATLLGVQTSVAALVADGGMAYVPDQISITPQFNTPLTLRPAGLTTVDLRGPANGIAPQQIFGFDPDKADTLELNGVLNATTANPDLSNLGNYIHVTSASGNTTLAVDKTGTGQAGTPFAVLDGTTLTLNQLLADHAISFTATPATVATSPAQVFAFRPEGQEQVNLNPSPHSPAQQIQNFSLGNGDVIDFAKVLANANVHTDMTHIANFVTATQSGTSTVLSLDPTGAGHVGTAFAVLQQTSTTMSALLANHALSMG